MWVLMTPETAKLNDIIVITKYLCPPGMKMMNILVHYDLVGCVPQYWDMNMPFILASL